MRASNLLLIAGMVLGMAVPAAARAAIVETIIDPETDATLGSIAFPTLTGASDAGVLFSFDGFTQADITSISWTLDPGSFGVAALDLRAVQGDLDCPVIGTNCSNTTLSLSPTFASPGFSTCESSGDISTCGGASRNQRIAFVTASVPEPSTWVLGMVGLLGLGSLRFLRPSLAAARRQAAV